MLAAFQRHDVNEHEVLFAYFKMPRNQVGLKVELVAGHTLNFLVDLETVPRSFLGKRTDKHRSCVCEQSA